MLYSNFSLLFTTKPTRLTHHSSTLIERIYRDFSLNWMRFMGLLWLTSQIICQSFDRRISRLEKCFAIIIISTWTIILEMPTLLICLVYSVNLVIFISKLLIVPNCRLNYPVKIRTSLGTPPKEAAKKS